MSRIWSEQVDATTKVIAEVKSDGGGGARALRRRKEDDETERHEGKSENYPWPYL